MSLDNEEFIYVLVGFLGHGGFYITEAFRNKVEAEDRCVELNNRVGNIGFKVEEVILQGFKDPEIEL